MKSKKKKRSTAIRRIVPAFNNNNNSNYIESTILKIWCRKRNFDDEFYDELIKNNINGLSKLQSLNRLKLKQLIKDLDWNTFKQPSNEDELYGSLDKVDKDSPMHGRYHDPDSSDSSDEDEKEDINFHSSSLLSMEQKMPAMRGGMMKKKKKMKSRSKCAAAPMAMQSKMGGMSFDDDDMNLGFAVGGANDIQLFRDQIQHNKMPRKTDITHEGIYNEYYFDTETKEKGKDIEQTQENDDTEQQNDIEETDADNKENEDEDEDDKPMFYPSYCYAKSRAPYALLMAESIKPKIKEKKKKKPKTNDEEKKEKKEKSKGDELNDMWKRFKVQFGYEPRSQNAFFQYTKQKSSKGISYKKAKEFYDKKKNIKKKRNSATMKRAINKPKEEDECSFNDIFEDDPDDIVFNVSDEKIKDREIFMTVGLNSNIKQKDFQRKKLNLVVLLDISGSMNKPFQNKDEKDNNQWGYNTKMQIASKAVLGLMTNLNNDDRFGLVTFNRSAQIITKIVEMSKVKVSFLRRMPSIWANGGTNFESGYLQCIELFKRVEKDEEYDNRIMILTDLRPNMGQKDPQKLMELVKKHAEDKELTIFTTFIGVGLDFNSDLVYDLGKIKGSNYCSVHSNTEFMKKMEEEFIYMVSPLVFNLKLTLKSEGDVAYIDKVYGSNADDLKSGDIMNIKSLFPSPPNESGETKGGIVLLKIKQKDNKDIDKRIFNMIVAVSFEDKYGKQFTNKQSLEFGIDNNLNDDDYYDNNGVHKGILLSRFVELVKEWAIHDRYYYINNINNVDITKKHYWYSLIKRKNKTEQNIYISSKYKKIFRSFEKYFDQQSEHIKDDELKRERDIIHKLCCYSDDDQ